MSGSVSACVCTRACASRGRGLVGTAAGCATSQKTELPANRRRGAAVNSRGRSLPSWGEDTTPREFEGDQRERINAIGAVGERELGSLFPQSCRMRWTPLQRCAGD